MQLCLHQYLEFHANRRSGTVFAEDQFQSITYSEARYAVESIASALQQMAVVKGDRVAILGKNSVDHLLLYLACARIGAVSVGLNYRLSPTELAYIASDAEVKCIFADEEFIDFFEGDIKQYPVIGLVGGNCNLLQWADSHRAGQVLDCQQGSQLDCSDILFQMYTSGTTGRPKGALLSHNNLIAAATQIPFSNAAFPVTGDRYLVIAPLYHAAGILGSLGALIFGISIVIHRDYDPVKMIETLANNRITATTLVPSMLQIAFDCVPDIESYQFPQLRSIRYGAAPISESLLRRAMAIFQCDFSQSYGQTESTAVITTLSKDDHERALVDKPELLRSCGRAAIGTEIKIVNAGGEPVACGEAGEIVIRGPQVMSGYWNLPKATATTVVDGWLYTGDVGRLDEEGYLYLLDRIKDVIISGAENIYPTEIESVLISHPDIQDCAVVGVADKKWGEVPLAVLVVAESVVQSEMTIESLKEFCRDKLASYKLPKKVRFLDVLPRNASGKLLRRELRES